MHGHLFIRRAAALRVFGGDTAALETDDELAEIGRRDPLTESQIEEEVQAILVQARDGKQELFGFRRVGRRGQTFHEIDHPEISPHPEPIPKLVFLHRLQVGSATPFPLYRLDEPINAAEWFKPMVREDARFDPWETAGDPVPRLIEWARKKWPDSTKMPDRAELLEQHRKQYSKVRGINENTMRAVRSALASDGIKRGGAPTHHR